MEGLDCLRCSGDMQFLKEYRFESRDNNRGILGALFDVEEHLSFNVYVCPNCGHSEFFHTRGFINGWAIDSETEAD